LTAGSITAQGFDEYVMIFDTRSDAVSWLNQVNDTDRCYVGMLNRGDLDSSSGRFANGTFAPLPPPGIGDESIANTITYESSPPEGPEGFHQEGFRQTVAFVDDVTGIRLVTHSLLAPFDDTVLATIAKSAITRERSARSAFPKSTPTP
jgi:hypothetical protein